MSGSDDNPGSVPTAISQDVLFKAKIGIKRGKGSPIKKNGLDALKSLVFAWLVYLAGTAIWLLSFGFIGRIYQAFSNDDPPSIVIAIACFLGVTAFIYMKVRDIIENHKKSKITEVPLFLDGSLDDIAKDLASILLIPVLQILERSSATDTKRLKFAQDIFCESWGYSKLYIRHMCRVARYSNCVPIPARDFIVQLNGICSKHKDLDAERIKIQLSEILKNLRSELKQSSELTNDAEQLRQHYEKCIA